MARQQESRGGTAQRSQFVLRPDRRDESSGGPSTTPLYGNYRVGKRALERNQSGVAGRVIDGTSDGGSSTTDSEWLMVDKEGE